MKLGNPQSEVEMRHTAVVVIIILMMSSHSKPVAANGVQLPALALVVGSNRPGEGQEKLRFSHLDAERFGEVLSELGGYKVHRLPRKTASIAYANILTTRKNVYVPQYSLYKIESREQLAINQRIRRLSRNGQLDLAASLLSQPPGPSWSKRMGQPIPAACQSAAEPGSGSPTTTCNTR